MKCVNCGMDLPENVKFCPRCGTAMQVQSQTASYPTINETGSVPVGPANPQAVPPRTAPGQAPKQKKVNTIAIAAIGVVGVLAFIFIVYSLFFSTKRINVTKGVEPEFTGADGYGSVAFTTPVPFVGSNPQYAEMTMKMEQSTLSQLDNYFGNGKVNDSELRRIQAMVEMDDSLSCSWQNKDGTPVEQGTLANGDKVVYACTYNEAYAKPAGYKFTGLKTTYTVSGLKEVEDIDLFEGVSVEWSVPNNSRIEPEIKTTAASPSNTFDFKYRVSDYDQNGIVIVEANISESELLEKGYHAKDGALTKTFDIGNQPVIINNPADEKALEAAQLVTDQIFINDMNNCSNTLSLNNTALPITDYSVKGLEDGYPGMDVVYYVDTSEKRYTRSYSVIVVKLADGSYQAYSTEKQPDTIGCVVSSYGSSWNK